MIFGPASGQVAGIEKHAVHVYTEHKASGSPMASYIPKFPVDNSYKWLTSSCTPVHSWDDEAMNAILQDKQENKDLFGGPNHWTHNAARTFKWPQLPKIKQKPLIPYVVDAWENNYFAGRGDTCLCVFAHACSIWVLL